MREPQPQKILADVAALIEAWCERRCLTALREILKAWPLHSGMTDEWGELLNALERVRAFAKSDLAADEARRVEDAIHETQLITNRHR